MNQPQHRYCSCQGAPFHNKLPVNLNIKMKMIHGCGNDFNEVNSLQILVLRENCD